MEKKEKEYDISGLTFPLICKINQAGGSSDAHKMGIVFNEAGLHDFEPPMIAQEFLNHNSVIFKVFVIGEYSSSIKRKSVPNIIPNQSRTIFFDSQKPLEEQIPKNSFESKNKTSDQLLAEAKEIPQDILNQMSKSISKEFGLSLFGYDVIVQDGSGKFGVIDINYFPGYIGVPDFENTLATFLLNRVKEAS